MSTFSKLTDYFPLGWSRAHLAGTRTDSRRGGSDCRCSDRRLERNVTAKLQTLPSIPQSPTATPTHGHTLPKGQDDGGCNRLPLSSKAQEIGFGLDLDESWKRRRETSEGVSKEGAGQWHLRTSTSEPHVSSSRSRSLYMRKSVSVDEHLGWLESSHDSSGSRVKVKLRRKLSLGSVDKKECLQKRSSPPRMNHQVRDLQLAHGQRVVSPSSPSAAKRLYRNLSGKFKVNYTSFDETSLLGRNEKNKQRKSCPNFQGNEAVFEAVEQQDLDAVQMLLNLYTTEELDLNTPNSEGLMPLDIAIMTNNVPMAKLLLQAGAKESPHFVSLESRAAHLATLVHESEQRVSELSTQVVSEAAGSDHAEKERQLKTWEWQNRLFKRMKRGFEHARVPDAPVQVWLSVAGSTSIQVTFQEPLSVNSAVVTKYKVEWSTSDDFSSITGESILEGIKTLACTVTGLVTGTSYYVRVSAYNMKGWGPPQSSTPPSAAPSYWGDFDNKEVRRHGRLETLEQLLNQVKILHQHCPCHENAKVHVPGRKHSMSKSLKHFFQPTSKFVKSLKRGLYLAAILYKDDDVVVTHEEQVPVVNVDDSYSSSLMQDFLWFMKVSYMWEDSRWLAQCMTPSSLSCSSVLQARHNMLVAVAQLQGLLGTQELGQLYFEPIKDRQGNVLIVTMRELSSQQSLENVRWIPLAKIQNQHKSLSAEDEPTALDILLSTLHEKVAFHRQSHEVLAPGLYLGYLKLCSSVDQIRVLVSQKLPNILCHVKIRNNHNVSRDEWEWLQMFRGLDEPSPMDPREESPQTRFQEELRAAVPELVKRFAIPLQQVKELRLYSQEVLEFAGDLSFLLLLPPSDDVCTAPGQNSPRPQSGLLTLPLQTFELVHFFTYDRAFIRQYCQVSALLELDLLLSQQALREAFSDSEVVAAKHRHQQVQDLIQKMEEVWREVRWIMDVLQYARYKQPPGGIPLCWLLNFTRERGKEQPQITPASPDYLPSPSPSPETKHRHLSPAGGSPTTADEEGSSEVFLTMSSDRDSRAQSSKQLDLIPSSSSRRISLTQAEGTPDVLRAHGPQSQKDLLFYDSDFVPPSRQIELLHITEKRQAYCVRTSSLDVPAQPFHIQRNCWSRAESLPESPVEHNTNGSGTKGYRLNQVHTLCPENTPESKGPTERIALTQSSLEKQAPPGSQQLNSVSLSVYPQYQTGLAKEMSVKLCISSRTSAREIVTLVIRETNEAVRRMRGRPGVHLYREDQLENFGLVLLMDNTEKWIQDDVSPLSLQNPWTKGQLCVRMRGCTPSLTPQGTATAV